MTEKEIRTAILEELHTHYDCLIDERERFVAKKQLEIFAKKTYDIEI